MSRTTKRKHCLKEIMDDDYAPPAPHQRIVQVLTSKGNNLHHVQAADGSTFLASMPTKFRRNIWVKRGDYVLVEEIPEGDKVKAEMVRILTSEHIKYYRKDNVWPSAFDNDKKQQHTENRDDHQEDNSDDDDDLFVNTNRLKISDNNDDSDDSDNSRESSNN